MKMPYFLLILITIIFVVSDDKLVLVSIMAWQHSRRNCDNTGTSFISYVCTNYGLRIWTYLESF